MEPKDLKVIQEQIKFDAVSMSACLGIDYEQYRRFLYGTAKIPESVARAAMELVTIEKEFDIRCDREYCQYLDAHYPQGIKGEEHATI